MMNLVVLWLSQKTLKVLDLCEPNNIFSLVFSLFLLGWIFLTSNQFPKQKNILKQ